MSISAREKRLISSNWYRVPLVLFLVFGALLPTLARVIGLNFLPSTQWAIGVLPYAYSAGAAGAGLMICSVWWIFRDDATGVEDEIPPLRYLSYLLFGPCLAFYLIVASVIKGAPMAVATFMGREVSLDYVVLQGGERSYRMCSRAILVEDIPLMLGMICAAPPQIVESLSNGSRFRVTGRGTNFGVFVRKIEALG